MDKYDIIIVGAGTAGCMTAKTLAEAGYDACMIDYKKREIIGEKVCGDALGQHHLAELDMGELTEKEAERRIEGIRVHSPDMQTTFTVKGEKLHGYMLNRHGFGQKLLKLAEKAGATLLDSTQALEPIIGDGFVKGVTARNLRKNSQMRLNASCVVDASGFFAVLRKKLPREVGIDKEIPNEEVEACYREIRELKKEPDDSKYCEIYLNQQIAPGGYCWVFPKAGKKVNVGIGVAMAQKFPNPKNQLYQHILSMKEFEGSKLIAGGAWYDPTRRPLSCMVGHGIAIVGDAASQVNPIHGGGIGPSMGGGIILGKTIAQALEKGEASRTALWRYNVEYMQRYGAKQAGLDVFRVFLQKCGDSELNYGMKYKLITEEDLLKASVGEKTHVNLTDASRRVFKGLRKLEFLRRLQKTVRLMEKAKKLYRDYPTSPEGLAKWKREADNLFAAVKSEME